VDTYSTFNFEQMYMCTCFVCVFIDRSIFVVCACGVYPYIHTHTKHIYTCTFV